MSPTLTRKPGRPKVEEPSSSVSTWVKQREHDALVRIAKQRDISVSAVTRALIRDYLKTR